MTSPRVFTTLIGALALPAVLQAQVMLDFETPDQFANNFRPVTTQEAVQTSNGDANDYVVHDRTNATTTSAIYLYDTTPGDTTVATQSVFSLTSPLTISFDFRLLSAGSSIGIVLANPANNSHNVSALFNADTSGTSDQFRFFRGGDLASGGAGTQVGTTSTASSGVDIGSDFSRFSLTVSVDGGNPTLVLTVGSQTFSQTITGSNYNFSGGTSLMLRLYDGASTAGGGVEIDNLQVVPEPSTVLLTLAALGFFAYRRNTALKKS